MPASKGAPRTYPTFVILDRQKYRFSPTPFRLQSLLPNEKSRHFQPIKTPDLRHMIKTLHGFNMAAFDKTISPHPGHARDFAWYRGQRPSPARVIKM